MLVFTPVLAAYTTLLWSFLIFRFPIPTPSAMLLDSATTPSPLLSLVSVVEEINTIIDSFPTLTDLVYSVPGVQSSRYLDTPPTMTSPISPPLNLPTCVPLAWPPLSDFGYFGTRTCQRVSTTDLVVWDGPSDASSNSVFMINDYSSEDIWYFSTLVASGVGFWLVCRLIAAAILKWSKSTSTEDYFTETESFKTVPKTDSVDPSTGHTEIIPKLPAEGIEESDETAPNGRVIGFTTSASFVPSVEPVSTHGSPSSCRRTSTYCPSPVLTPLIITPLPTSHLFNFALNESTVSLPLSTDTTYRCPIPIWSPKASDIVSFYDVQAKIGRNDSLNEVFAPVPMKRSSSLAISTSYTVSHA